MHLRCKKPNLGVQLLQIQLTLTPFAYLQVTLISKLNLDISIFAIKKKIFLFKYCTSLTSRTESIRTETFKAKKWRKKIVHYFISNYMQ